MDGSGEAPGPLQLPPRRGLAPPLLPLASAIFLVVDPKPRVGLRALVQGLSSLWSFLTFGVALTGSTRSVVEVDFGGGGNTGERSWVPLEF